jgi:hypothetical protein
MMKDLLKIASFLEKNGRIKDSNLIDYISEKYADGDLTSFFKKGMQKDFIASEFNRRSQKKRGKGELLPPTEEEEETEELLKSLSASLKKE